MARNNKFETSLDLYMDHRHCIGAPRSPDEELVERFKVAALFAFRREMSGEQVCNAALLAMEQHIKDLPDAKRVARGMRAYAKRIVEMWS